MKAPQSHDFTHRGFLIGEDFTDVFSVGGKNIIQTLFFNKTSNLKLSDCKTSMKWVLGPVVSGSELQLYGVSL